MISHQIIFKYRRGRQPLRNLTRPGMPLRFYKFQLCTNETLRPEKVGFSTPYASPPEYITPLFVKIKKAHKTK
jgi:hypothetical protein